MYIIYQQHSNPQIRLVIIPTPFERASHESEDTGHNVCFNPSQQHRNHSVTHEFTEPRRTVLLPIPSDELHHTLKAAISIRARGRHSTTLVPRSPRLHSLSSFVQPQHRAIWPFAHPNHEWTETENYKSVIASKVPRTHSNPPLPNGGTQQQAPQ